MNAHAIPATKRDPRVQKNSIKISDCPLPEIGRNSANKSNGTVRPPTPAPTITLNEINTGRFGAKPLAIPPTEIKATATRNDKRRPRMSANGPKAHPPASSPKKTAEEMEAT
mmetsp:Transcript_59878/g.117449  ORF Transcript_59878/g.117449 Transcript_59878/m.117449 type:complete len:112 (-) Transcript_59878:122-457(-)